MYRPLLSRNRDFVLTQLTVILYIYKDRLYIIILLTRAVKSECDFFFSVRST